MSFLDFWNGNYLLNSGPLAGSEHHSAKLPYTLQNNPDLRGRCYTESSICVHDGEPFSSLSQRPGLLMPK